MEKEIENIRILREHLAELLNFINEDENEFVEDDTLVQDKIDEFSHELKNIENEEIKSMLSETFKDYFNVSDLEDEKEIENLMSRVKNGEFGENEYNELEDNINKIDKKIEELEEYKEWENEPNEIETPEETIEIETPEETVEIETPEETIEVETPEETIEIETPEETIEVETPEETIEVETPEETIEEETPAEINEVEVPEEKVSDLPAIAEYKKETERLEKELEELLEKAKVANEESKDLDEMDEIIDNTLYPEIELNNDKIVKIQEEINSLEKEIKEKVEEKERYQNLKAGYDKFYEEHKIPKTNGDYRQKMDIYNKRINECEISIKSNESKKQYKEQELNAILTKNSELNGPMYKIEVWKLSELYNKEIKSLEKTLNEIKIKIDEYYKEVRSVPYDLYGMQTTLENQINEMKNVYTKTIGIRSEINLNDTQFRPVIESVKNGRKLNKEIKEKFDNKFQPEKESEKEELNTRIEQLKEEIAKRKENIAKYEDALNDIREIEKDIKSGKTPEDEEIQNKVENINNKISSITDEKLQNELREELKKALEKKKNLPIPIENKENKPKITWKTIAMLAAGLGLGATIGFVAPTGVIVATGLGIGLAKRKINKMRKKAEERRLKGENEIEAIELPNNKIKAAWIKFKQYIKSEEGLRDISWGLTGGIIGLALGKLSKGIYNDYQQHITENAEIIETTPEVTTPEVGTPTENIQDIRIGDSIDGHNITEGYDTAKWAVNDINSETLNLDYINSDSTFNSFRVVNPDGSLGASFSTEGTSLTEVINNTGLTPDQIAIDVAQNGQSQAWIKASDILGKGMSR